MTSTLLVLVIPLICLPLVWTIVLVATSRLAKRNGQALRYLSVSFHRGITAKFSEPRAKSGKPK